MQSRLSLLMFLVYAPMGAIWPLLPRYLDGLGFDPLQIALVCSTHALAGLFAPIIAGQIADRWLAPERCLTLSAFACGSVLLLIPLYFTPGTVFACTLVALLLMTPTLVLASAISFAHLPNPERQFGSVRLWGTVGWAMVSWLLGYILSNPDWLYRLLLQVRPESPQPVLADAFRVAAIIEFVLGFYGLTISATPPRRDSTDLLAPLKALRLLRKRHFAIFFLCNFLLCLTVPFAIQNTPLLLKHLGVTDRWTGPAQTMGQTSEILTLALLPWLLSRLGVRWVLVLGASAWAMSMSVQTLGTPKGLVIGCLPLNGLFITCFIVAGQVCVNSEAGADIRASAQALISFSAAIGQVLGYVVSGVVRHSVNGAFRPTFAVAMIVAWLAVFILIWGWEKRESAPPDTPPAC